MTRPINVADNDSLVPTVPTPFSKLPAHVRRWKIRKVLEEILRQRVNLANKARLVNKLELNWQPGFILTVDERRLKWLGIKGWRLRTMLEYSVDQHGRIGVKRVNASYLRMLEFQIRLGAEIAHELGKENISY